MFEQFTDRARKAIALANSEAQRLSHEYIGTEHILLGLAMEGGGVAANVLRRRGVDLAKVRGQYDKLVKPGPDMVTMGRLPLTPRAKKVVEYAGELARELNAKQTGTEHLLLAIARESDGVAAMILLALGLTPEKLKADVLEAIGAEASERENITSPARFTDRARHALELATEEARRLNHAYVGTEHILLGLLSEGSGVGANALKKLGVNLAATRSHVAQIATPGTESVTEERLPQTPRARKVIDYAIAEGTLNQDYVGTEHLLLGLVRDEDGVAYQVLLNMGFSAEMVRQTVLDLLDVGVPAGHEEARPKDVDPSERFSDLARKVVALANQEAVRFNHEYIDTEHLLLAISKEGSGVGAKALQSFGLDRQKVLLEVEKAIKSGPDLATLGRLPLTPGAKAALEYARDESRYMEHNYAGSGHLLLGLMREQAGIAATVLKSLGLKLEEVRRAVAQLHGKVD